MASNEISLTPSDVSNQTVARIAKPPNFSDVSSSEEEDDLDEPRPPPNERPVYTNGHRGKEPAKRNDASGSVLNGDQKGNHTQAADDDIELDNAVELDTDTVHDGDTITEEPGEKVKEGGTPVPEGKVQRNDRMNMEEKKEGDGPKSRDHKDPLTPKSKDGEKIKDVIDGNFDADNVPELVDRLESAVEAMSKGEPEAFDRLVAIFQVFLPMTLFMADELKMLRENKKGLLLHIRTLMKENQQTRLEAEQRSVVETKSVGTTPQKAEETCGQCTEKKPDQDKQQQMEIDGLKRESKKLRKQCKELQHVNLSWEKYSQKKSSRHEAEIRKMNEKLATSDDKAKKLEKRLEEKFRLYDQTLMQVKHSEERQKLVAAEYKKERDVVRMKYEEMKRQVKDQDEEIKRLNEVIARKGTAKVYLKPGALVVTQQAKIDDKYANPPRKRPEHTEKQGKATAVDPAANAVEPPVNREKVKAKDSKPQKSKPVSPPLSPRDPPGYMKANNPMSLTREELKDQVVLYKEQMDIFRADFNQERRDREKAVGQVDSLKKELEKTKKKVREMQNQRMEKEHDLYVAARVGGHMFFLPEDTQEMRMKEIKQQAHGKRKQPAHGRKDHYEGDQGLAEEHFYAEIE
ncbi:uncharacterized protein LOC121431818 [Lytechinus variegatus]|uniref:uncharacterized protein LOC121431818 n=1 Tax=Lytechinus variegatus TaxID=7654 RepID=UPI001BB2C7A7|nr:uncharacterized protein LOC121431818 [Lytechinus variegatus]XP_041485499.1 uncharacterized protein LOC121431818 [Lytechinus variegatus]